MSALRREDLRTSLLRETRTFLETGDARDLSLRELARRLGVAPSAPYRHFESKEALLAELAIEGFVALAARLRSARIV